MWFELLHLHCTNLHSFLYVSHIFDKMGVRPLEVLNFKNPKWRTTAILEKMADNRHLGNRKIAISQKLHDRQTDRPTAGPGDKTCRYQYRLWLYSVAANKWWWITGLAKRASFSVATGCKRVCRHWSWCRCCCCCCCCCHGDGMRSRTGQRRTRTRAACSWRHWSAARGDQWRHWCGDH